MTGWCPLLSILGVLSLSVSISVSSNCPSHLFPTCSCGKALTGGYEFRCPDRPEPAVTVTYTGRRMWVECNAELNITSSSLLLFFKDMDVELDSLVLQYCPLLQESYANLIAGASKGLRELRLDESSESEAGLTPGNFEGFDGLETLRIQNSRSKTVYLDPNLFRGVSSLRRLFLTNLQLSSISPVLLAPLKNLLYLDLTDYQLKEIPSELLASQEKLKDIKLAAIAMKTLPAELFLNASTLQSVELEMNFSNGTLPESLFSNSRSLKSVTVHGNGLEFVSARIFSNTRLEHIDWSNYKCAQGNSCFLTPSPFTRNIYSLKSFSFYAASKGVSIRLPRDMFLGCNWLRSVALKFTETNTLTKGLFASNRELRSLDLQNNGLTDLPDGLLEGLSELEELNLGYNKLTYLESSWLRGLSGLRVLQLQGNSITAIDNRAFTSSVRLEVLDLSENKINFDDRNQPIWYNLTALKVLNLANNENTALTRIPHEWTILRNLRTVDLSNNRIGPYIEDVSLDFVQRGVVIDLSNNRIKRVTFSNLELLRDCFSTIRKKNVLLSGNPLECDAPDESVPHDDVDQHSCSFPDGCLFASAQCPPGCVCSFTPLHSCTLVDCGSTRLSDLPEFVPLIPKAECMYFNLRNNNFLTLTNATNAVRNYSSITYLDISSNRIREVSLEDLPPNLNGISLNDNSLTTVSAEILKMPSLKWLRLGGNNYECGCRSKPLYDFLLTDSSKVRDIGNITLNCKDRPSTILDMKLDDFCLSEVPESTIKFHHLIPPIISLVLLLAIVVSVVYYKTQICTWLYSMPRMRWMFLRRNPESDAMEYDVFVSYSCLDRDFAEGTLLKELEHGSSIQYKCLVHSRNFVPGRNIVDQISDAVHNSRRTLIVLSRNFVVTDWCRHEFNVAHSANSVIIIALGELPTREEMGELMWQYVSSERYLQYGGEDDRWFWDRLRYLLPHKNNSPFRLRRNRNLPAHAQREYDNNNWFLN